MRRKRKYYPDEIEEGEEEEVAYHTQEVQGEVASSWREGDREGEVEEEEEGEGWMMTWSPENRRKEICLTG